MADSISGPRPNNITRPNPWARDRALDEVALGILNAEPPHWIGTFIGCKRVVREVLVRAEAVGLAQSPQHGTFASFRAAIDALWADGYHADSCPLASGPGECDCWMTDLRAVLDRFPLAGA